MSEWIKCSDRLPEDGEVVICTGFVYDLTANGRFVEPSVYLLGEFFSCTSTEEGETCADIDATMHPPTHWQPLPAPPAE